MSDIEKAERETVAQLEILRALKPLTARRRRNVMEALDHLLAADCAIPGVLEATSKGLAVLCEKGGK